MVDVLKEHNVLGKSTDKYPQRDDTEELDFLEQDGKWDGDIITNPPYKYAGDFIRKSLESIPDGRKVAIFVPIRYLSGKSRRKIFEEYPPYKVWVSSSRLACAMNGDFEHMQGSAVGYCWIVWHKGYQGETKLGWFN